MPLAGISNLQEGMFGKDDSSRLNLDMAPEGIEKALKPLREQLKSTIQEKLWLYDVQQCYPRLEDAIHQHRDGYESFLQGKAIKEIRQALQRYCMELRTKPLWTIGAEADEEGLIVQSGRALDSARLSPRLRTGSLVEETDLVGERLQYKLVSGMGPPAGWITNHLNTEASDAMSRKPLAIVALLAVHIPTLGRLRRFMHVLRSIASQRLEPDDFELIVSLSWSAATPDLQASVHALVTDFIRLRGAEKGTVAAQHRERRSQFEHMQAALEAAESWMRTAMPMPMPMPTWVIFGDDDDLWHPERVATYMRAIRAHSMIEGVAIVATTQRVCCAEDVEIRDYAMPRRQEEVDEFIRIGGGKRLDEENASKNWFRRLRSSGDTAPTLPTPDDLAMEYFHLCPRLRIVHEFFDVTEPNIIQHRYCDLRFSQFLLEYPRKGREMGLEVSWFEADCWMYFYACPGSAGWEQGLDTADDELLDFPPVTIGREGHMATEVPVEKSDIDMANQRHIEFKAYQPDITVSRLTKYLAAFRNYMEAALVPRHKSTLDQRCFDAFVCGGVNASFGEFGEHVSKMPAVEAERASRMMYRLGQLYAKSMAKELGVDILWHYCERVIEPVQCEDAVSSSVAPLSWNFAPM